MAITAAEPNRAPALTLAVQYALAAPQLPRWRLRRWVRQALNTAAHQQASLHGASLTLRLVGRSEARHLNRAYRQRDYATNVLTFTYGPDPDGVHHGDIVLCLPVLAQEAKDQAKPLRAHAAHLVIHGVLHALGHDHLEAEEAQRMEALEVQILARMAIADPYA